MAALLRPGPRRALLPPEQTTTAEADQADTLIGDRPDPPQGPVVDDGDGRAVDGDGANRSAADEERRQNRVSRLIRLLPVGSFAGFGRPQLAVIVVIVALGVLFGGWAVLRARPVAIGAPRLTATTDPSPSESTSVAAPAKPTVTTSGTATVAPVSATPATIRVHVIGAVHKPGVVSLPPGARVQDAIQEAGGTKKSARLGDLNLAQPLTDGQQVFVGHGKRASEVRNPTSGPAPDPAATGAVGHTSTGSGAGPTGGPVDLNTATLDQLDELPGVGPVTAQKILDWRSEHGKFTSVAELQEVDGIGPKTFADLKPEVTV